MSRARLAGPRVGPRGFRGSRRRARRGRGGPHGGGRREVAGRAAPRREELPAFALRLSEGRSPARAPALVARPPAERIATPRRARVLDRLPPLAALPREEPFAIREASLPPPRTGRTVRAPFPPADEAARPEAGRGRTARRCCGGCPRATCRSRRASRSPSRSRWSRSTRTRASRARPSRPGSPRSRPASGAGWARGRSSSSPRAGSRWRPSTASRCRRAPARPEAPRWRAPSSWTFSTPPPRLVARHPEGGPARRDTLMFAAFDQRDRPGGGARLAARARGWRHLPRAPRLRGRGRGGPRGRASGAGRSSPAASSPSGPSATLPADAR